MTYIIDTSSFIVMGHFFPNRFPSFWERFNQCVDEGEVLSVREVYHELDNGLARPHLRLWLDEHRGLFLIPQSEETEFVREMFSTSRFQTLIRQKYLLTSKPIADPFVIAAGRVKGACIVTEEAKNDTAIRIPNICEHYRIECISLEELMEREGWAF